MSGCFRNRSASLYVQLYSLTDLQQSHSYLTFLVQGQQTPSTVMIPDQPE